MNEKHATLPIALTRNNAGLVLVNLGCGFRCHSAWNNLDLNSCRSGVVACNFLKGIPLTDRSADALYCAAVLEHLHRADADAFVADCFRVLKPGGVLRISVPDFEAQARLYLRLLEKLENGETQAEAQLEWMVIEMFDQFSRDKSGGAMAEFLSKNGQTHRAFIEERIGKEGTALIGRDLSSQSSSSSSRGNRRAESIRFGSLGEKILRFLIRSKDIARDRELLEVGRFRIASGEVHRWAYSYATLAKLLESQGFTDIQRMPHGESRIPGWKDYHLEIDTSGRVEKPDLVVVEARRCRS